MSKKNRAPKDFEVKTKKKEGSGYRVLGIILAVVSLALLFLPLNTVIDGKVQSKMFITSVLAAAPAGSLGLMTTLSRYALLALLLVSIVLSVLTILNPTKGGALAPYATLALTSGTAVYFFAVLAITSFIGVRTFDIITLAVSVLGIVVYSIFAYKKIGKAGRYSFLQFLLSVLFSFLVLLALGMGKAPKDSMQMLVLVIFALAGILFLVNAIRVRCKENDKFAFVCYIAEGVVALLAFLIALIASMGALSFLLPLVAALVVFGQFEFAAMRKKRLEKEAEEIENEDTGDADENVEDMPENDGTIGEVEVSEEGYHIEEYAEAVAYEGGPVAGVEMAEEVNTTETADYDFYNSKAFDAFIATLDTEERNQFTELFLLRYQGSMPEIPEYVVGGDNREFFCKIFIYLGQYRERIPSGLLTKMYNYSVRVS